MTRPIGFPFPEKHRVHLRYVDFVQMVSPLGVMAKFSYFTNGLFDPQVSVGGHQPMGWDQAIAYYNFAVVLGSKIKSTFEWTSNSASALAPAVVGMELHSTGLSGLYTDWTAYAEAGYDAKVLPINAIKGVQVAEKFNHEEYFQEDPRGALTETGNFATGNCVRTATYSMWIQSVDKATTSGVVLVKVQLDYDVEFSGPKQIPQS